MSDWKLTVGLEIHIELATNSKMFCACANDPFDTKPNTHICPVCLGLPGALPVMNQKAVEMVARLGRALNGTIESRPQWSRKNYFYPDLPKGYQISQYDKPLVSRAKLTIDGQDCGIERIHLEEDTAKLSHKGSTDYSLVNFNRAGVPLMELVTKPDFHTASAAKDFCKKLQEVVRELNISTADMEKGQMRCEANISVSQDETLGTKVEVKNLNSFKSVERAIEFEYQRQIEALEAGEKLVQETRAWLENSQATKTMRVKETSADYRYFPEPDLLVVDMPAGDVQDSVELPEQKRNALKALGLSVELSEQVLKHGLYALFVGLEEPESAVVSKLASLAINHPEMVKFTPQDAYEFAGLVSEKGWPKIVIAKAIADCVESGGKLVDMVGEEEEIDLDSIVGEVLAENPQVVVDLKGGNERAVNVLVGKSMAKAGGKLDVRSVRETIDRLIKTI